MDVTQHPNWSRQVELEKEMTAAGATKFLAAVDKAKAEGRLSDLGGGLRLLRAAIEPTAVAIKAFLDEAASGRPGRRHLAYHFLKDTDPTVLAYITARVLLDQAARATRLQVAAHNVAGAVEDEARFRTFEALDEDTFDATVRHLETTKHRRHRRRVMVYAMNKAGVAWEAWPTTDSLHVGMKLIDLFIEATHMVALGENEGGYTITATPETLAWLEESNTRHALLCPVLLPALLPPKPWSTPFNGGYWTSAVRRTPLVKTRRKGYLEELTGTEMPAVYTTVNALQATGWRINRPVLDVALTMWDAGLGVGTVLPDRENQDLPRKPSWLPDGGTRIEMTEAQKEEFKAWRLAAAEVHGGNAKAMSRRMQATRVLALAERFKEEPSFYFPHNLDFRGRVYSMVPFLSPQGSDLSRGLLTFSQAKPINDHLAAGWLAIHGANTFGFDKAGLDERIAWVEQNEDAILRVAAGPLDEPWWQDADKPWEFLAFCFEWAGFQAQGFGYMSSLPLALDGSCNGIQHFSAMLRDPIGGAAVNLVPSDKPSDIYAAVAEVATAKLRQIASTGGDGAGTAQEWLAFGIDRKTTKRSVMVLPYGGTYMSCKDYVAERVVEQIAGGQANPWAGDRPAFGKATHALAKTVWTSISEVVVAAKVAMTWLQKAARVAAAEGLPINWIAPSGFPVQQAYAELKHRRVKTRLGETIVKLTLVEETDRIDVSRQVLGISPNFVHSMDAAALCGSVVLSLENGVTSFAMVHDSYGTHAADTEMLAACLRHAFVDLYTGHDVLEEFRAMILELLPEDKRELLPKVPPKGTLDLGQVLQSDFFFA